ncbi:molybdopterin-dependent oxidoreductase [Nocardioides sp. Y6]|uniref:Molybdopterin-dependent oxidoreductase n=1 Tax=Nocardioides malaquae TaxID=2773426 RepID=A0ABR9RSY6_9ACTN|nr:molybdopterin-dependent oxidoreductase [Nocardioides malaquae]MBE7324697.1 molybdopterin-dependent oxidoreductase [Nocardioides malaquae]
MTSTRAWAAAGAVTGGTAIAVSQLAASVLSVRESPLVAVAEVATRATPGIVATEAVELLAGLAKPLLVVGVVLAVGALFAVAGALWPQRRALSVGLVATVAAVGLGAVVLRNGTGATETLPIGLGAATWLLAMTAFTVVARRQGDATPAIPAPSATPAPGRRGFLATLGVVGLVGVCSGVTARWVEGGKSAVQDMRRLLRIPGVTQRSAPRRARIDVPGVTPWQTPNDDFYRVHTAIAVPAIDPATWKLRIHGMVEREVVLTYDEVISRGLVEAWVTLGCVSNEVGGPLLGNAWWSGVPTRDLLALAGPAAGADAVLQTSEDGWTCSTPLDALTDERGGMLAVAMNGEPLPLEHGFPARTVVPGLYGYTSACKWVVDWEVTRFADVEAYWTQRDWAERAPMRLSSRIDVPLAGEELLVGPVTVAGVAWLPGTGVADVQVSLDGGAWTSGRLAAPVTRNTWVQWAADLEVGPGPHTVRVRAVSDDGEVQTGVRRDPLPDGATGWHEVEFTAVEEAPL